MAKPPGYYSFLRKDVLPYIPDDAKTILSLGCSAAITEGKFRQTHDCKITGIEVNPHAAKEAEKQIDEVIVGDLMRSFGKLKGQTFDCILALDILEHLPNPWLALKMYTSALRPGGVFIASIPNINHRSIRAALAFDVFPYRAAGILDLAHMRFFTLTEIYKLFAYANLKITFVSPFKDRTTSIQYIVGANHIEPPPQQPLATVIIPTLNNLDYTKGCIESLRQNTHVPYQVIVVDNGSKDGTRAWLESQRDLIHILNLTNIGFGPALNQALQCISTPYVVISNNDILFTPDWLLNLLAHANKDPDVGLVGPVTNFVSGPQLKSSMTDVTTYGINSWAKLFYEKNKGRSRPFPRLVFFCVLIKSSVIDKIGLLDERFITGNFEDDDFCLRASQAGFKLLIADDVFIYHYGHATFKSEGIDFAALMAYNQKLFMAKWGIKKR